MTNEKYKKVKLKGNESFNFREGWLRKGMRCVCSCPTLFSQPDVMEQLGVGSKMVKSIRFWLQACNLTQEKTVNSGRARAQFITDGFGEVILKNDPYFDDIFTLFLIHYHIVKNDDLCVAWNLFFNEFDGQDFTKDEMVDVCEYLLNKKMDEGCSFSESSFEDDCTSIIKMYAKGNDAQHTLDKEAARVSVQHPEESLTCPLVDLGLLQKSSKVKGAYIKTSPSRKELDKLAVLYVILDNLEKNKKTSVSVDDLHKAHNNIGRVFNMDRVMINEYLDELRISGYLMLNRTAGLDMVYVDSIVSPSEIMKEYYERARIQ